MYVLEHVDFTTCYFLLRLLFSSDHDHEIVMISAYRCVMECRYLVQLLSYQRRLFPNSMNFTLVQQI